jgi:ATP-dependent helicase/nuclease subunit A
MTAETVRETANNQQRAASNPSVSAFVSASAGSGKTKLLTDRLLRLMLSGTPPEKILCLTYTKAAAAEMAIRLNRRLGEWVVLPEAQLNDELAGLAVATTLNNRERARKLFADVLDLPGGMRIGTIHAFCQSLLRRFPLEAGISPHFELADDNTAAARLREARETVLSRNDFRDDIGALAAVTDEMCFAELTGKLGNGQNDFRALLRDFSPASIKEMQRAALDASAMDHDELLRQAISWERERHTANAWRRIAQSGTKTGQKLGASNLAWLAHETENRVLFWVRWVDGHFTQAGKPRDLPTITGKNHPERDDLHAELALEHARIEQIEEARRAAKLCAINTALLTLAAPTIAAESNTKASAGLLSYADLITHTGLLLKNPGTAWVLYKLDGGIDHLLLDEVQDTAPAQWEIANAIAEEFFAGQGARAQPRSIFAVGDAKQSIFSFQGADLHSFARYRDKFETRVKQSGHEWLNGTLSVSFRSTAPVLALVDAVFAAGPARTGVCDPDALLEHGVSRTGQAGAVSLWPLTEASTIPDAPAWDVPNDYAGADSAQTLLARAIAQTIKSRLDGGVELPSRGRAVAAGDFLILVRRRDALVAAITSECKKLSLPIAGADRMVLTEQQAVADLLALCDALLLPEDDLAFAHYLASPLGGLSDDDVMQLALRRHSTLAAALASRRAEHLAWTAAYELFTALRARVDYLTPHALLANILFERGGRARLLARLGAQAAEPIDELLSEAAAYARAEPASLQSFVHAIRTANATIKREADAGGAVIRIMTVHGAKGLQAPIVILPDTTGVPKHNETLFWLTPPQQPQVRVPIFAPRAESRSNAVIAACEAEKDAERAEQNRLLYVALTRAEDELIICGAAPGQKLPENCWYELVKAGFDRMNIQADAAGIRCANSEQTGRPDRVQTTTAKPRAPLPAWAGAAPCWRATPLAMETRRPEPLAPSRAAGDDAKRAIAASPLGGGLAAARVARANALARGRALHALLQHLPDLAPAERAAAATAYLAKTVPGESPAAVLTILNNPELAALFGPGSRAEVPLAGIINDVEIGGLVDRLAILPDRIILADYKTDRSPPAAADAIPATYLRQLAAYTAILRQIYPDRPITCILIFTQTAAVLTVPAALLAGHAPAMAQPYAAATTA